MLKQLRKAIFGTQLPKSACPCCEKKTTNLGNIDSYKGDYVVCENEGCTEYNVVFKVFNSNRTRLNLIMIERKKNKKAIMLETETLREKVYFFN